MPKAQLVEGAIGELRAGLDEVLVSLSKDVRRTDRRQDRADRRLRKIACVGRGRHTEVLVYLRADPKAVDLVPGFPRDVTGLDYHGTGDLEVRLRAEKNLERVGALLRSGEAQLGKPVLPQPLRPGAQLQDRPQTGEQADIDVAAKVGGFGGLPVDGLLQPAPGFVVGEVVAVLLGPVHRHEQDDVCARRPRQFTD
ncbi:hypothetical protein ACFO3J_24530 [Streptomyces polygonati]|uniref:DUF5655 domain-containing protein n=1 Tax=Streptomyces polygonati TaxID=1617087 RepID=A0ABV8HUQ1_9ACTN